MAIWILVLGGGLVSGTISGYGSSLFRLGWGDPVPGICFGVLILLVLQMLRLGTTDVGRKIVFVILSILAYIAAFWSTFFIITILHVWDNETPFYFAIFIGGIVGALILCFAGKYLLRVFTSSQIFKLTIASGILGVAGFAVSGMLSPILGGIIGSSWGNNIDFLPLFVIWQVGMMGLMAYFFTGSASIPSPLSKISL